MGKRGLLIVLFSIIFSLVSFAQTSYKLPPKEIVDIVTAPPTAGASLSPTGNYMLLTEFEPMPSIAYISQPLLRLAGLRITPQTNSAFRTTFATGFTIKNLKNAKEIKIKLPAGAKLGNAEWSLDDKWVVFTQYTENDVKLWAADVQTGNAKIIVNGKLNMTIGDGVSWLKDNKHIIVFMIPEKRGKLPVENKVPTGPTIQENLGKVSKAPTFQDMLKNYYDEQLFDYYTTSQVVSVDVTTGAKKNIGKPAIYTSLSYSPNGEFILAEKIKRPYSYTITFDSFPTSVEIWNNKGELVKQLADLPLADEVPLNGVPLGPRSINWRPLEPATLIWVEALDGGDPEKMVPFRDKIMALSAPFINSPNELIKTKHRFAGIAWLEEKGFGLLSERDWKRRWQTTYLINADKKDFEPKVIFDLSSQDAYGNPGRPVNKRTKGGENVVISENSSIYLSGVGSSPKGDMPFLDRMNLLTMQKDRLFQCKDKSYESFIDFAGNTRDQIITRYESKTEVPNYFMVNLNDKSRKALTSFKDPAPKLTNMKKELIKYTREDGVELSGTLYLPPNYKEGERLPLVMWAYPIEYSDAKTAGQVKGSEYRFTFFRGYSQLFFATQGYAVLDNAQMPVVGDPKTMNDTFIPQIVSSAKAAIDKLDKMGIIDPKKVGVGGHSYGAFMTAHLLTRSDLFAAGIARSGAYNRTLTPFGFQSERRTLWEVPQTYLNLSPFMFADKIKAPILLTHGEADNNQGTFPIQSERFYQALKGHGATVRFVLLPNESHGYSAKESVLHVLAEMFEWFDKYVKNKK